MSVGHLIVYFQFKFDFISVLHLKTSYAFLFFMSLSCANYYGYLIDIVYCSLIYSLSISFIGFTSNSYLLKIQNLSISTLLTIMILNLILMFYFQKLNYLLNSSIFDLELSSIE